MDDEADRQLRATAAELSCEALLRRLIPRLEDSTQVDHHSMSEELWYVVRVASAKLRLLDTDRKESQRIRDALSAAPIIPYAALRDAWAWRWQTTTERRGQALWNAAFVLNPDGVEPFRATAVDPYYDETRVDAFFVALTGEHGPMLASDK